MSKEYEMRLILGDWSDDGHGHSKEKTFVVNYPVHDVQEAYKASCKLTGVSFNHNEDYTDIRRDWQEAKKYQIATEYEQSGLYPESYNILKQYPGFEEIVDPEPYDGQYYFDDFSELWWWFVKLSLPDLVYSYKKESRPPVINGYWNDNLNVQFGYGLFNV